MVEFYDRIEEAKKGFEYFPEEWEKDSLVCEKFPDFVRSSIEGTEKKDILSVKEVDKNYVGFARIPVRVFKNKNLDNAFTFLNRGDPRYSQFESDVGNGNVIETHFYHSNSTVERIYVGRYESNLFLKRVRRTEFFDFENGRNLKMTQTSKNYMDIEFFKGKKKIFDFFLNGEEYLYHKEILPLIKACPEIFLDLDTIKTYFSSDFFEGNFLGTKMVMSLEKSLDYWKKN